MKTARLLSALLLMSTFAVAGTSANYSLAPDAVDSGGLRGTSASYTLDASAMAGGQGSSATYTARTGYAGQLLEPGGLSFAAWQVQYFGVNNPAADPQFDPDGDGWDNLFEYNACLIPTDPLSTFSFSIEETPGGGHVVTFSPRLPGCTYSLLGSSNLTLWEPVTGAVTDAGSVRTILDPAGTGPRRFYFIQVQRQ